MFGVQECVENAPVARRENESVCGGFAGLYGLRNLVASFVEIIAHQVSAATKLPTKMEEAFSWLVPPGGFAPGAALP